MKSDRLIRLLIREALNEHMKPVGSVKTSSGEATVFYDPEITMGETATKILRLLRSIPERERMKSTVRRVEVFDNPEDVTRRLDDVGIYQDDLSNGAFDFRSGTLYTCVWDGYQESPRTTLHEFGHSIVGVDEEMAESWYENYAESVDW